MGRKSEIINVGGEKVYPQEVENVIQEMENVAEVTVFGEKNSIIGNIVCAKIRLETNENKKQFIIKVKEFCRNKLETFKLPVKVLLSDENLYSSRFKKVRI